METLNQKSIEVLNNLMEIHNERIEGYERAAKEMNEFDLKNQFTQCAETSYKCKQELMAEVRKLGGTPAQGTRTTTKFHRAWMDIKAALASKDRKDILNSCGSEEDVAVKNYKDALKDNPLGSHLHSLILKQYSMIKADQDEIKILCNELVKNQGVMQDTK